jgi:hypothetical protein
MPKLRAPYTDAGMPREYGAAISCGLSVLTPGYADVAIGAPGENNAFVYFNSPGAPSPAAFRGPAAASRFGGSVAELFVPSRASSGSSGFPRAFVRFGAVLLVPGA